MKGKLLLGIIFFFLFWLYCLWELFQSKSKTYDYVKDIPALDTVYFTMPNYYLPDSFVVKYRYSVTRIYSNTHPKSIEPQGFILQGKKYNSTYFTITDSLWQTLPNRPSSYDSLLKQTPQLTEDDYDANTKSFMRALLFFNTVIGLPLFILLGIIALVYEKKE